MRRRQGQPRRARVARATAREPQGLWAKLDAARKAAEAIEKGGEHHGTEDGAEYEFARVEDVVTEAKRVLSECGLLVIPSVTGDHRSWRPDLGLILKVEMEFKVVDVETGESIDLSWIGYGQDKVGDKAIGKGISGAKKYALSSLLEIAFVGIDPEEDQAPAEQPTSLEANRIREKQDREAERPDLQPVPDESDLPAPDMAGLA